ncbi:DUF2325 domain-containing protein [soil metagenome]
MSTLTPQFERLMKEHLALSRQYGEAQQRCSALVIEQRALIDHLTAQLMMARAAVIVRDSALMFAREDFDARVHIAAIEPTGDLDGEQADELQASLRSADLVICQTGCLSHDDYWRVQDHCRRTGKPCVMAEQPEALRIVHIRR